MWLGWPTCCTLCCSKWRHSPRQLRVAAEVAFRSSRSWSKAVRGPDPGRDSMACTRFFCCPSTWFIIYRIARQHGGESQGPPFSRRGQPSNRATGYRLGESGERTSTTLTTGAGSQRRGHSAHTGLLTMQTWVTHLQAKGTHLQFWSPDNLRTLELRGSIRAIWVCHLTDLLKVSQ